MDRVEILKVYESGPDAVVDLVQGLIREFTSKMRELTAEVQELKAENRILRERVHTLEKQLSQNSRNSSKPPSSDGYKKPSPKSLREKGNRTPGGQIGHKGHTLEFSTSPDKIVIHQAAVCTCGHHLEDEPVIDYEKRQVHDLPPIRLEVTEHQVEIKSCPCCSRAIKGTFPADVKAPVQYGPRLRAAAIYLNQYQLLPYERTGEIMEHLFGHALSEGTLVNANMALYEQLEPVENKIKDRIISAPTAHFDETGMRVQGKNHWCHISSTDKLTHYFVHAKRGKEAMDEAQILPKFKGTAVHDAWASYFQYDHCHHALCNAHHLRELVFVLEQEKQVWAKALINLLLEAKAMIDKEGLLRADEISRFAARYDRILELGIMEDAKQNPLIAQPEGKRGKPKQSKPKNLLDRLLEHRLSVLSFLCDPSVPFDNNQAERDVRMVKVQQKISGTFRSEDGAKVFCRIRSYISTVKKNAGTIIDALEAALRGNPLIPPALM